MTKGLALLAELVVVHGYFADPATPDWHFAPDAASARLLFRAGIVVHANRNHVRLFAETAADGSFRLVRLDRTISVRLNFGAPGVGEVSAPLEPLPPLPADHHGSPLSLAFDSRMATPVQDVSAIGDGTSEVWHEMTAIAFAPASDGARPRSLADGFSVTLDLDGTLPAPRFRVVLAARAVPWRYVLIGDWPGHSPQVNDPNPNDAERISFAKLAVPYVLANGASAIAWQSQSAIALSDHNRQRFDLCDGDNGNAVLIRGLPRASPANLVLAQSGAPSSLVCEIFVHH
ncbi:hypothetical protein [Sandarakinorhabdus sp.]|uniref:hypothetical protein n=1 Tax=Sandarakinorhabdus sp. TaxID=1916663 RepID=UPI00334001DA